LDLGLTGRRALVTGSSRGTGKVIVRTLAREGATVVVHATAGADPEPVVRDIEAAGGKAFGVIGDLATDEGASHVAIEVLAKVGGLDILVNNQGQPSASKWSTTTAASWLDAYQVNTLSAVRMISAFLEGMRSAGFGRIVQIATIGTARPGPRMPDYYASKAAMANLTVSLARDVAGSGVTVNTVSPGLIHTPETEAWLRHLAEKRGWGDRWEDIEARGVKELAGSAVGRMARPEEVADLVAFVVSDRAGYLNGANFRIDGGASETVN